MREFIERPPSNMRKAILSIGGEFEDYIIENVATLAEVRGIESIIWPQRTSYVFMKNSEEKMVGPPRLERGTCRL